MKLNDFFQTQKNIAFTDVDKLELYQKFLYKKSAKIAPVKRFSFIHAKAFVYTMVVAFLVIGMYGMYFFNDGNMLFNSNTVQADYIAKVISFDGDFSVEHQGRMSQTENISDGDSIILKEEAEMTFQIDSATQSKIIGPAKLTIQKVNEDDTTYRLNLVYGDYIQVEGNTTPQNVELAIDDILIKQEDHSTPLNFQFVNEGKGHIIKNNGANLLLTKNGDAQKTQIGKKEVLAIENSDIKLFQSRESFSTAIQRGEVSQTFAINTSTEIKTSVTDEANTGEIEKDEEDKPLSFMALLVPSENEEIVSNEEPTESPKESISKDIETLMGAEKKIPTDRQNELLRTTLGEYFLYDDMKEAYTLQGAGGDGFARTKTKIFGLCGVFGVMCESNSLTTNIKLLKESLMTDYEIPSRYTSNLSILANRVNALSLVNKDVTVTREEFEKALPMTLLFK